ncbi:aminotransferase class I/II-fold pyridoxal phosphate-dependent enzyme [Streptomyces sp. UNOB3_S3]|uniref:aminotransferase class I/II-fold pyridoxal phosphate-dependent enzyme n=1 Tax=Streptomyces sp. UNOB3_S3 TaxID=2871682 RepID=UPI001E5417F1|nr:aminotransferase class I/II-fold pyridoxal phosphate-dependent enzyme [Streptomyces sp. UNOB3_S3]MCC3777340.1 aminotransferase class V-fold PLP-dependent enzyme [Streptomyces sp. UNOB3_S3]
MRHVSEWMTPASRAVEDIEGVDAGTGLRLLAGLVDEVVWLDHCPAVSASFQPVPTWLRHEPVSAWQPLPESPPGRQPCPPDPRRVCVSFAPEHGDNARTWARTHGYRLLAPDAGVTAWAADKISATRLFAEAGVTVPPFLVIPATGREPAEAYWSGRWPRAVAQRAENNLIGRGTVLIEGPSDLRACLEEWPDEPVKLSRFSPGISLTVTACAGPDRTVVSAVSHQLVGLPELAASWGAHCGNQLVGPGDLPEGLYGQARTAAYRVGEVLRGRGFRGVFGLDLVEEGGRLRAVEVNPRFQTVVSLVQAAESAAGLLPALGLHVLSFLLPALPPPAAGRFPAGLRHSQLVVHARTDAVALRLPPTGRYRRDGRAVTGPLHGPPVVSQLADDEALWWAVACSGPVTTGQELALVQFPRPVAELRPRPRLRADASAWLAALARDTEKADRHVEKDDRNAENEKEPPLLRMTERAMREAGRHTIDLVIDRMTAHGSRPPCHAPSPGALRAALDEPLPEHGTHDLPGLLDHITERALAEATRLDHPRCFAFVPSTGNFPAVLADALASAYLSVPGAWLVGAGPTQVELTTLRWLKTFLGLPDGHGGLFVSGGSTANLTCLAAARDHRLDGGPQPHARLYCSTQAHPSVAQAAHLLGLTREQLTVLPPDDDLRLDADALAERIGRDRRAGLRPFAVVATLGTAGTGTVDPLDRVADLCQEESLWLHVDGAHGAAVAGTSRGHHLRNALGRADSLTVDPHKWLFQPYEIGCVLLRRPELLPETFGVARHALDQGYLRPAHPAAPAREEVNLSDYGPQQSRGLRALKLWLSLKTFGAGAFRQAIEQGAALAEYAAGLVAAHPELELVTPPSLAILTFRYRPRDAPAAWDADAAQAHISRMVCADGGAVLLTTTVRGATVLRMCTINPTSTRDDAAYVLDLVTRYGRGI